MADVDLREIAAKLEDDRILMLKYRALVRENDHTQWVIRTDRLLDVSEDRNILYVDHNGEPAWVRIDEAIEVISDVDIS